MSEKKFIYKAFISYAQNPDKHLAKKLEDRIERFGIGWHRLNKQKLFVFRDVTDLVPNNNLPSKIEDALSKSEFLIVLAQKKFSSNDFSWANVEAEYFVKSCVKRGDDPADYIILAITDGDIAWNRIKNQWDYELTNVIPYSLREIFKHEPLYVDLRPLNDKSVSQKQKNQVFQDALIAIVAKLLYKKPSEIQNQIIRLQRYAIGFIALILVFISVLSVYAKIQKDSAVANEIEAKEQEGIAVENARIADENAEKEKKQRIRADENAEKEKRQRIRADKNARMADENAEKEKKQRIRADENAEKERKQRIRADENANEARRQEELAKLQERKTDTINKLIEAENLALKASDFFKALNDTLVSSMSVEEVVLAREQRDSIMKAFKLFDNYEGLKKPEHRNKLETLYTSDILSSIFFNGSKSKLNSEYDRIYQTLGGKTVVYNLNGQIYQADSNKYVFNNNQNFVEATSVKGTNFIAYSNYDENIKLVDIEEEKLYQVETRDIFGRDVITEAYNKSEDVLILNSKGGASYQVNFKDSEKSFTPQLVNYNSTPPVLLGKKSFAFRYSGGELSIVKDSDTTLLKGVSSYCIDGNSSTVFWGTPNGEVYEYRVFGTNPYYPLISVKDRINNILIDPNNQILAVQAGANQLIILAEFKWGFTKIYQETIGRRINDMCLGKDGFIYVLYDRNRLVYWPVKSALFKEEEDVLVKQ